MQQRGVGEYGPDGVYQTINPGGAPIVGPTPSRGGQGEYGPDGERLHDPTTELDPLLGAKRRLTGFHRQASQPWMESAVVKLSLPWVLFLVTSLVTMLLGDLMLVVVILTGLLTVGKIAVDVSKYRYDSWLQPSIRVVAVALGFLAGSYNYEMNAYDYFAYHRKRQYANVWPSEVAAAHRDASAIVFPEGALPDARLAGSFTGAYSTYCVAPIALQGSVDPGHGAIQYWAVGTDCCPKGKFHCGAARDLTAHAGLVVYDRQHRFSSMVTRDVDMYALATRMVSERYGASSAEPPIYLRWVKDPEAARVDFINQAWLTWLMVGFAALPASLCLNPAVLKLNAKEHISRSIP